jgi:hypothetical protein
VNTRRKQAGITALGFLLLASLFGVLGLGVLKITPMYLQKLKLDKVLSDVQSEFDGTNATAGAIRNAVNRRFEIEDIRLAPENVTINQVRTGYEVRIQHDSRAHYIADVWLLVAYDRQIEIRR